MNDDKADSSSAGESEPDPASADHSGLDSGSVDKPQSNPEAVEEIGSDDGSGSIPDSDGYQKLIWSRRKEDILEYSLVLASQGLKHFIEFDGREFVLSLETGDFPVATELLQTYERENRSFREEAPAPPHLELFLTPFLYLLIPTVVYFWVGFSPWGNWWERQGRADAALILDGEWWRCFTATTLHADHGHYLSNLVSGYFILNLVNHRLGVGSVMLLATVGAGLANYLVALTTGPGHISLGFSTVVFCALGKLAALETLHLPRRGEKNLKRVTPLLSAFFIAVLIGLGENADVKAHFYGFGIGAALGFLTRYLPKPLAKPAWQAAGIAATYALYTLAWGLAGRD